MKQCFIWVWSILLAGSIWGCDMDPVLYDGNGGGYHLHHEEEDGGDVDAGEMEADGGETTESVEETAP